MKKKSKGALRPTGCKGNSLRRFAAISILMTASAFVTDAAFADSGKAAVNIPPQELSSALKAFASQTGIQILYAPEIVQGSRTGGVSGSYAPEEALKLLLKNTDVSVRQNEDGVFTLRRSPARPDGSSLEQERAHSLEEVVVTATKTERKIAEVPASVSVITAKDIQSQQAVKVEDLLRNVEGVDVQSEASGFAGSLILRGVGGSFAGKNTQVLVDGMAVEPQALNANGSPALEFAGLGDIERIEVVRGPASSLYGPSAMGGVINILTKRWTGEPGGEVELGLGSHNAQSVRAAVGGASEKFDLRVSASDFQTDGFIAQPKEYAWNQKDLAGRDWSDRKFGVQMGVYPTAHQEITFGVRNYSLDAAWVGGRPNYRQDREGTLYDLGYKLDLGSVGDLKVKYTSASVKDNLTMDGLPLNGDPTDFTRYITDKRDVGADTLEVQGNFRLTPGNLLTVGASHSTGEQTETVATDILLGSPVEISWGIGADYLTRSRTTEKTSITGLYLQDEIRVSENLLLNIGGRYDRYKLHGNTTYEWDNFGTDTTRRDPDSTDNVFTPRVGLRYKLAERTSLYASYGEAYVPATHLLRYRANPACNNPDLKAERSTSTEIGLNQDWAGLSGRLALFQTDYQDKIEKAYPAGCPSFGYENVSAVQVNGIEAALEGKTASAWRPYINYAYTDSKIDSNPNAPATEGKRLNLVAKHKFNLGVTYAPSADWTTRFSGRYVGDRYADLENTSTGNMPGYFVADLKISKRVPLGQLVRQAELTLAVNNLFDKEYVSQKGVWAGAENFREFGDGRNWWLGLRARF